MRGGLWLLLAGCAGNDTDDLLPDGPVWTGSADWSIGGALAAGDLDGDGLAELVIRRTILADDPPDDPTSPVNDYTSLILTAPFEGGPIQDAVIVELERSSDPEILEDVTGDGLGELVFGVALYSGLPDADAAPTLSSPRVALKTPCTIEGLDGFCDYNGFWAPDGTELSLDLPWGTPITPAPAGVDLWTREFHSEALGVSVEQHRFDTRAAALPVTTWGPFAGLGAPISATSVDLTRGGGPTLLLLTADGADETLHLTSADAVTLDGPSIHLGDVDNLRVTVGDFDGDGQPDLALRAVDDVHVFRGPLVGARSLTDADRVFRSDQEERRYFGLALATGDLDGDGRDDLVIGDQGEVDRVHVAWGGGL